ncbi:transferrin-like isoform X2 [Belonocnema kinseyi]|uniref:transferrin-like isoform X2 n=1 Tax=Belonocnema kinseyi TaxID=2817044 RepID=UPI00143CEBD8|nr:transferrin-like isoform X2 [Belonocnema kinseyi]
MYFKLSTFLALGFFLLLYLQATVFAKDNKLRFCTVDSRKTHRIINTACQKLVKTNSKEVECVVTSDRVSCLNLLLNGTVDFMTAEPEDLFIIGSNAEYNHEVLVTQELRIYEDASVSSEMVIIVHKSVKNLGDTYRMSLCLSGMEFDSAGIDHLRYFEKQFVVSECDPKKTLLENRMSALSSYFGSACIGGPWTSDEYFNTKLKRKYYNLCSNCQNPQNCLSGDIYAGPQGSLLCLTEGKGDIAWARAADVLQHFQTLNINKEEYKFLCPDSRTRTLYDTPCVWLTQPWRTIIARKNVAGRVSKFVIEQNKGVGDFPRLLEQDLYRVPVLVDPFKTPDDYLEMFAEYYALKDHIKCKPDRRIKWCVATNLEYQKCKWLSNAAQSRGVEPSIECVKEISFSDCISSLRNWNSDIFVIQSLNGIEATTKGLKPIVHMLPNATNHENQVVALVGKYANFKSLEDIKYHNACFSGYRDVAELKTLESTALNCLAHTGDVAFINLDNMTELLKETFETPYRPICVDESTSQSKLEEICSLTWTPLGSVMMHTNVSKSREQEIYLMLVELNALFGNEFKGDTPQISMYGTFEGTNNVLFPDKTYALQRDADRIHRVPSYSDILDHILKNRHFCNDAERNKDYFILTALLYFLIKVF